MSESENFDDIKDAVKYFKTKYHCKDRLQNTTISQNQEGKIGAHQGHGKIYYAKIRCDSKDAQILLEWDTNNYSFAIEELRLEGRFSFSDRLWWISVYDTINNIFQINFTPSIPITYYNYYKANIRNSTQNDIAINDAIVHRIVLSDPIVRKVV